MDSSSRTEKEITTDLLIKEVNIDRSSISDLDQKLFYFAKCQVAQEKDKLNDCEICIDFKDQDAVTVKTNDNPSRRIYVGYDKKYEPVYIWERGNDGSKEVGHQVQMRIDTEVESGLVELTGNGIKRFFKVILPWIFEKLPLPKFLKDFLTGLSD